MTTKKLLVETLNQLSPEDFDKFKLLIGEEEGVPVTWRSRLKAANTQDVVELMVETYSRECVKVTTKVLMKMSRTDLVQRLSGIDSGTKEEVCPPLVQRVETMASVIELLLETSTSTTLVRVVEVDEDNRSPGHSVFNEIFKIKPKVVICAGCL